MSSLTDDKDNLLAQMFSRTSKPPRPKIKLPADGSTYLSRFFDSKLQESEKWLTPKQILAPLLEQALDGNEWPYIIETLTTSAAMEYGRLVEKESSLDESTKLLNLIFILGVEAGKLQANDYPPKDERQRGLDNLNKDKKETVRFYQDIALLIWEESEKQGEYIRLKDMCDKVEDIMLEHREKLKIAGLYKYLPEDTEGYRSSLRKVAPEYAKKAGRPKKQ